ncbi:MAG: Hsp70 family protein [Thermoguttaceae bacterium]|nr:Hsp70 family protein [Thermoguttaceae bacterium]
MGKPKAVGIDLGTTNSVVAWIDAAGRSSVIRNAEGEMLTPSVVLFDQTEVVVGREARYANAVHPDQVAIWVKRDMGNPVYNRPIRGEYLPPEVIQACILRKLKADIIQALGSETHVVITVPAYFDEPRRKATADAGEMAGLKVLDIVNEPTAAALSFGETLGYLSPEGTAREDLTVLVYDLGGGTFDVTLLRLSPGNVRTLATDGDVHLGGYDWDMRLVVLMASQFQQAHGADPRQDPAAFGRLYNAVLEAKHALSARSRATIPFDFAGHTAELHVTREQFDDLTADLLERTACTTRQLVTTAGLGWNQIDRVLLVGGATRMPSVVRMLSEMTRREPDHSVNPDEAVARGAAIYAHWLLAQQAGETPDFQVTNVNSHSLGVEGVDPDTLRKTNYVLIPRNSPLPATRTEKFTLKEDDQRSIVVQVLEGESTLPGDCTAIGRTVLKDLPPGLPKGWPVQVTFQYEANGRLSVHAVVPGTDREVALDIERNVGLTDEGLANWKQVLADGTGGDAFFEAIMDDLPMGGAPAAPAAAAGPALSPTRGGPTARFKGPVAQSPMFTEVPDEYLSPMQTAPPRAVATVEASPPPVAAYAPNAAVAPVPLPAQAGGVIPPGWSDSPRNQGDDDARLRTAKWIVNVIGFALSSIVGLALGYWIVWRFFPDAPLPRLW